MSQYMVLIDLGQLFIGSGFFLVEVDKHINEELSEQSSPDISNTNIEESLETLIRIQETEKGESVFSLRSEMQNVMQNYFGVYRNEDLMREGINKLEEITERTKNIHLNDKSHQFNSERVEVLEYLNLLDIANATAYSALERKKVKVHMQRRFSDRLMKIRL